MTNLLPVTGKSCMDLTVAETRGKAGRQRGMHRYTDVHPNNETLRTGIKTENTVLRNNF